MATHSLNYKVLFLPEENLERMRYLRKVEDEKGYFLLVGYTDLGAFLTPLDVCRIQDVVNRLRKEIGDLVFSPYKTLDGLGNASYTHINMDLKTFVNFSDNNTLEVVLA